MRVLMLSGDKKVLDPASDAGRRTEHQRSAAGSLSALVWPQVHSWRKVVREALRTRPHLVTAQDPFWRGVVAWVAAKLSRAKLQLQVHADLHGQSLVKRLLGRFTLRRAHSVRAVSERVAEQVRKTGTKAKVHVLPIYVDLTRFQGLVRVPHERPTILWVGRFEKEKDPLYAIEVLRKVRKGGLDAALVMLGAGRLEKALHKAARGLPVEFPGWQKPEEYLPIADVLLSTSPHESWGSSIVEALAAHVPVVSRDVGVAKEAGAIVVEKGELAGAVQKALEDKPNGELRVAFLDQDAWVEKWKETLAT